MSYFDPLTCEETGALHRWFGTRAFRPFVAGGRFWQQVGLAKRRRWRAHDLNTYVRHSKTLEIAHLLSLGFLLIISVYFCIVGDWMAAGISTIANLLLNFYPILVVRYNRHRIESRLSRRRQADEESD
ncbi:MAG: hypothetical protein AAGJ86_08120 [Pseudomonadota bacterium]